MMMRRKKEKTKITLVVWYDAVAENGWTTQEDAKLNCKLDKCVSVGHFGRSERRKNINSLY